VTSTTQATEIGSPPSTSLKGKPRPGDRNFAATALGAGIFILVILAAVTAFLLIQGVPGMLADPADAPTTLGQSANFWEYVWPLAFGTIWASILALAFAVPLSIGIALFISHYAHRSLAAVLGYVIDLLAAVPSVVYGLWGSTVFAKAVVPIYAWLNAHLGWIPLFAGQVSVTGRTILTAAMVLAVMVLPIITAICREVFLQTPKLHEEAALALGATRWEMIRMAVLPFARPGIISGAMLGLGRALGETMAVAMVLSATGVVTIQLLTSTNPSTIPANIALKFGEAGYGLNVNVLIGTGLVLFVVTFGVNALARWIVSRRSEFSGAN
jgi:phosphate transport system permease protein